MFLDCNSELAHIEVSRIVTITFNTVGKSILAAPKLFKVAFITEYEMPQEIPPDAAETVPSLPNSENASPQPTLKTERLFLRPFQEADSEQVQHLLQSKEIAANTRSIEHPYPDGAGKVWIGTLGPKWNTGAAAVFAICYQDSPAKVMGAIGLEINSQDENAELGYWIGVPYWGQGLCTEAAAQLVQFGFNQLGLKKIHAHHIAINPASGRVMEKIGMVKEGYLKSHIKKWGVFQDIVFYGIVAPCMPPGEGELNCNL